MKKKLPKKYAPGELERVRKKLGDISLEEAEKMSQILGGEVGIEEDSENIKHKYDKLQARKYGRVKSRRKKRNFLSKRKKGEGDKNFEDKILESKTFTKKTNEMLDYNKESVDAFDRIRLDFLCSKPEYRLKPVTGAIASLFSFFIKVPDYINPQFIKKSREYFFTALYNFVTATRGLYTKTKPNIFEEISKHAYFSRILYSLKSWDITGIDIELSHLRKRLKRMNVRKLAKLCSMVYYPFGELIDLDIELHIKAAIEWAYNINMQNLQGKAPVQESIKKIYYDSLNYLPIVFYDIKKMFYPLLLKLITNKFYLFNDFLSVEREKILGYLGISEENVLFPEDVARLNLKGETEKKDIEEKGTEENKTEQDQHKSVIDGINVLEYIFPNAGWKNLHLFPELYSYFHPIFHFPDGFELISRFDPLHQIMVFCNIIGNLLYGFRHINFNFIRDEKLEAKPVKDKIDYLLTVWPVFMDEIISELYLPRLKDYCNNIEKDSQFQTKKLGKKILAELNDIKKMYFLPYHRFQYPQNTLGTVVKNFPKFHKVTEEATNLLGAVSKELQKVIGQKKDREIKGEKIKLVDMKCESVLNPWKKYYFDLKNPVAERLENLLLQKMKDNKGNIKTIDRRSNANLIIYTYSIFSILNNYIKNESSHFYKAEDICPFRSLQEKGKIPEYNVSLIDPKQNIYKTKKNISDERESMKKEDSQLNSETGFYKIDDLNDELAKEISTTKIDNTKFSIIYVCLTRLDQYRKEKGEGKGEVVLKLFIETIKRIIRHHIDKSFRLKLDDFIFLLSNTDLEGSFSFVRRVVKDFKHRAEVEMGDIPISIGILEYKQKWDLDKTKKMIDRIELFVNKQKNSCMIYFDEKSQTFKLVKLKL